MTVFGVVRAFFSNTSTMTMASESSRYMIRQVIRSSFTRSSWTRGPIDGIGRDQGSESFSPDCSRLSMNPASTRAKDENGGVFTSPWSQTSGLSDSLIRKQVMSYPTYCQARRRANRELCCAACNSGNNGAHHLENSAAPRFFFTWPAPAAAGIGFDSGLRRLL